jgi:purine-cytosine permease-like protein
MTHIELAAPTLADPIYLVNGAAPRRRFRMLWDIAQREAGPVVEVVTPSTALRAAAIALALGIAPGVFYRLFNGELLGSLLMLAVAAFLVYAGLTGLPRLYRKNSE